MQEHNAKEQSARSAHDPHVRSIVKILSGHRYARDLYQVFGDCMELMALTLSNTVDLRQYDAREARYMQIVAGYTREQLSSFAQVLAQVRLALSKCPGDVLGAVFGQLEVHNKHRGQFFTPYEVCRLMAGIQIGDGQGMAKIIEETGYVTVMEPACGAGAMVIAFAEVMQQAGFSISTNVHVTANDIDCRAAHMAYVQLALMGVPAVVTVGNALTMEEREVWYTPAHVMGGWAEKLRSRERGNVPGEAQHIGELPSAAAPPLPPDDSRQGAGQLMLF